MIGAEDRVGRDARPGRRRRARRAARPDRPRRARPGRRAGAAAGGLRGAGGPVAVQVPHDRTVGVHARRGDPASSARARGRTTDGRRAGGVRSGMTRTAAAYRHRGRRRRRHRGGRGAARARRPAAPHHAARARGRAHAAPGVRRGAVRVRRCRAPLPFDAIQRHAHFDLHRGTLAARRGRGARRGRRATARPIRYDKLLVAVGARPRPALPGAITFAGPADAPAVGARARARRRGSRSCCRRPPAGRCRSTSSRSWPPPSCATAASSRRSPWSRPSPRRCGSSAPEAERRGRRAAGRARHRAAHRRAGASPSARGALELRRRDAGARADRVIALPRLDRARRVPGLPHDATGSCRSTRHGRVPGVADVFAAGDATTFPLKQGGLATQQADAAAEAIAAELGVAVEPAPFRPVLRGLLLTGGAPLYLRSALTPAGEPGEHGAGAPPGARRRRSRGARCGGRRARSPAATSRRCWPPPARRCCATSQLQDFNAGPVDDDRDDARELALLLADEDAAMGDYAQALHALDAAAALTGGVLPAEWAASATSWLASRAAQLVRAERAVAGASAFDSLERTARSWRATRVDEHRLATAGGRRSVAGHRARPRGGASSGCSTSRAS